MRYIGSSLAALCFIIICIAPPSHAERRFAIHLGYVTSSASAYGDGLIYGATILEGKGHYGFGISMLRFDNSISYQRVTKQTQGVVVRKYQETFSDFTLGILGTYTRENSSGSARFVAGMGPEVHFLNADRQAITEGYTLSAKSTRLGLGIMARVERVISIFGGTRAHLGAGYSWMESGVPVDEYSPPLGGANSVAVTAGLAFPF